ncbi:MAG: calcium-translocating P-type ATPase, PMCA-type [Bacilli bacterium]|nr:calcium-translocating P-type ATPase, PMCA-type [Bacilli bacterium]
MNQKGVKTEDVAVLRKKYGSNQISQVKGHGFWKLLLESLGDPIIKILLVALGIKVVFLFRDFDWFETVGILIAVFLATFISTISEYGSEAAFQRLQEESSQIVVKVLRDGVVKEIPIAEVVVSDVVLLVSGDKIPADGYLIEGSMGVDESSLNGESKEAMKYAAFASKVNEKNEVYRGTVVLTGMGRMLVTKVGDQTFYGNLAKEVQESEPESPLKMRLRGLAKVISRIGYIGAFFVTLSYLFSVIVIQNEFDGAKILAMLQNFPLLMDHLIYALTLSVTIIVVAVPEGLPMMITLVLSSNMKRMLKRNVLVRRMVGIETTGSLNYLLTDKTGTLTKGKLEVTNLFDANLKTYRNEDALKQHSLFYEKVYHAILWNNDAMYSESGEVIGGNSTDRSLLSFVHPSEMTVEVLNRIPFDSKNKYSAITVSEKGKTITYLKGAIEKLLPHCTRYLNASGEERYFAHKEGILEEITRLTKQGNRLLLLGYMKDRLTEGAFQDLVFLGIVCIRDELREEASLGIEHIRSAGIQMIMITGDHPDTARAIATECGLIESKSDLVLTSNELQGFSDEQIEAFIPRLRVVARALPQDKSRLVRILQNMDQIVGMTGDGVNDAPALKKANVGFAMGSGTEVSKEASDIVILDDNIESISTAILYGRTIFKSIRKFIIYQLTCNMCALFLSIVGPFIGVNTPITIIQMLWINMIMDTFAGLAFSFEPALLETMKEPPKKKNEPIMNTYMYSQIIFTGIYSALLCIFFLKAPIFKEIIRTGENYKYLMTAYFALFIFIGVCNAFNARTHRLNLFAHLKENIVFVITIIFICSVQCYLIYHGGDLFRTYGLTAFEFAFVLLMSFSVIPVDFIRKYFMKKKGYAIGV